MDETLITLTYLNNNMSVFDSVSDFGDIHKMSPENVDKIFNSGLTGSYWNKDMMYVFVRPYLFPFLDFLFENFDVGLWTAAERKWMNYILDNVLNQYKNKFLFTWCREKCDLFGGKKNITCILDEYNGMYKMNDIILIDDNFIAVTDWGFENQLHIKEYCVWDFYYCGNCGNNFNTCILSKTHDNELKKIKYLLETYSDNIVFVCSEYKKLRNNTPIYCTFA